MIEFDFEAYASKLPLGELKEKPFANFEIASELGEGGKVDAANLPSGIIAGSNLVGFEGTVGAAEREGVAFSLMAAEMVADSDQTINSPALWIQRYRMLLEGMGWIGSQGGWVEWDYSQKNISVHKVVIPILSSAFAGTGIGALIVQGLEGLAEDDDDPWITLFDRESRHLEVTEYRFAVAEQVGSAVNLRLAAARLRAKQKKLQIFIFKSTANEVNLRLAQESMAIHVETLKRVADGLRPKLNARIDDFIRELPL
jgi:hypothetical protein